MSQEPASAAFRRAGRRVMVHMIQAAIEGLKAVEAVIEEIGGIANSEDQDGLDDSRRQRIEIE